MTAAHPGGADAGGVEPGGVDVDGVEPVAIVGIACRLPGASSVQRFWRNMRDGVESITTFDRTELLESGVDVATLDDPDYIPASGHLPGADLFDAEFFGFTAAEAATMDPQHRLLCETAWLAMEDSGHDPATLDGSTAVMAGAFMNKYLISNLSTNGRFQRSPMAPLSRMFNDKDFLATRVAHLLDLHGPAYTVQTACSTSLVATHLACQALLNYECDTALAGGVSVNIPLKAGYPVSSSGLFSPDGHCRPFDRHAAGTVPGNGSAMVVLRRLSDALADADHIYAVIRGSACNNDGIDKAGFAAPSVDGQARVIASALGVAGVDPGSIGYLEAHGTATQVGDPIEVAALRQVFGSPDGRTGWCALGSVKANIGHLDAAAGIAGLLRATLAVQHGQIPPAANFTAPNPELRLASSPFYVPTEAVDFPADLRPRRAGVSSFGVGGTNAHVVLEQAPPPASTRQAAQARPWQLITVSGRDRTALQAATTGLADHLAGPDADERLADVAFTLQTGRRTFGARRFAVCADTADAVRALRGGEPGRLPTRTAPGEPHRAVFAFPGAGMQHRDMGLDIYRSEEVFRTEVDRCADLLAPKLGFDLRTLLFPGAFGPPPGGDGGGTGVTMGRTQGAGVVPALFVTEYALARQLMAWGVQPIGMIGHSLGEYVAACLAGVFPLSGALELTLARGELFAAMAPGRMLVVALPEQALTPRLPERISVSAVNAPDLTVVAGPDEDIAGLLSTLRADGVDCRPVGVPVASHSWMVEPFLAEFLVRVKAVPLSPPRIPFISGVSGTWITDEQATDPRYWAAHLRRPVRFADGVREVFARPGRVLVEVGPGRALSSLTTAQRLAPTPVAVPTMGLPRDSLPDLAHLVGAVGKLWQTGVPVDWQAFHGDARPARVPLPGYPFQRSRHWIAAGRRVDRSTSDESVLDGSAVSAGPTGGPARDGDQDRDRDRDRPGGPRTDRERQVARIWCDLLGVDEVGIDEDFFELGAHSLMVTQVTKELRRMGATTLTARDVLAASTVADMAALVDTALGVVATAPRGPALDLAAEVVLPEEITGTGSAPAYDGPARTVLLTGATGFVGAFLCAELLASTKATVLCLVRAADEADALERLRTRLEHYGLPAGPARRLRVVVGDLAAPLLGLPEHRFDELAGQLDAIYHCGAWVNFVRPYRALKAANVLGTQEVLRLACRGRLTPVHYISTLAVLAGSMGGDTERILESDPLPPPVGHDTAYSQSKWVAEGLIGIARRRGIPVSVYRAGGVLPDSRTGATNTEDYVTKVIQGCVQLGLAPRRQYALSVGTVDHLARLVVSLASRPPAGPPGVGSAGVGGTFHTIDPRPLAWNEIFVQIRRFGYPVRSVPFDDWRSRLIEQVDADGEDNALAPLMAMIGETPDRRMPVIDCSAVAAALPPDGCAAPELDEGFFGRMLGFFVRGRLLPPIPVPASGE